MLDERRIGDAQRDRRKPVRNDLELLRAVTTRRNAVGRIPESRTTQGRSRPMSGSLYCMPSEPPLSAAHLFDALGVDYERAYGHMPERDIALEWLGARLPSGAHVLDVGSGTGVPAARALADKGYRVVGIDVSPVMVDIARRQVPDATFLQTDVLDYDTEPGSLDAACVFFSLLQIPRAQIDATVHRIADWLRPGGYLVLAAVPADIDGLTIDFLGHPIRVSSYTVPAYLDLLRAAGMDILETRESTWIPEGGGDPEDILFVYCHKPAGYRSPPASDHDAMPETPAVGATTIE
ncbi:class I SAM-dependent methyltransferase [Nocardia sp. NPDC051570]|uniref:class I SAM-dependent methyltransferase n=1 Tax=Nocardia sp. NPDC051570 TaxID=3364324 RepID=UPI0037B86860